MSSVVLSIVIVTYNSQNEIENVIQSIVDKVNSIEYEIIVVDNNSTDRTTAKITNISNSIKVINNLENVGFGSANNQGFREARGNFILILNPDIILTDQTRLKDLCERLKADKRIGIIAPKLIYPDGRIQESVRGFPNLAVQLIRMFKLDLFFMNFQPLRNYILVNNNVNEEVYVDWVIGAFMLIRKDLLFNVGLFDSRYFMYMEDADLCMNLNKKGYRICYSPQFSAIHSYKRDSSKGLISNLKWAHIKSSFKFYFKHGFWY
jgi:GT2 family glycosyltransferase